MAATRNIRVDKNAWMKLRNLKFRQKAKTYTDIFNLMLQDFALDLSQVHEIAQNREESREKKTIVISAEIHEKIQEFKIAYMIEYEATARGKGAANISDIVIALVESFNGN